MTTVDYPQEWDELPKTEKRKQIRQLKRARAKKAKLLKKLKDLGLSMLVIVIFGLSYQQLTKKTPEQIEFEQEVEEVSLEGKVEEFPIEGSTHTNPGTDVGYQTNPPTSGDHYDGALNWGVYSKEVVDEAAVHGLEHGGIWISYNDLDDESKKELKEIGKSNSLSVIVSPRAANDARIAVVSWGRMIKLDEVDTALIQKYIDTYKNQSPEKLAR